MDTMNIDEDSLLPQAKRNPSHRFRVVCLGLLCTVLLAGNVGQLIFYGIERRAADATQAKYDALTRNKTDILTTKVHRLQSSYDALTADKEKLEGILGNLTVEKDQLQQSYQSMNTERDKLDHSLKTVTSERDQLQANYSALKQESEELQASHNDVQKSLEGLETKHDNVNASLNQLQMSYANLQREKHELQTRFNALIEDRNQLEANYSSLRRDKEELQRSFNILHRIQNQTEANYSSLQRDKNHLQTRFNAVTNEKEQLQTKYNSLAADRDQLQKNLDTITLKLKGEVCQTQWRKFQSKCYFVSTVTKNWAESRRACVAEGADLVIINSRDEQVFVNSILDSGQNAWIGYRDSENEGTWLWVDGTQATTTYWESGQPNSYGGDQDCGEFVQRTSVGEWNDEVCSTEQRFVCET